LVSPASSYSRGINSSPSSVNSVEVWSLTVGNDFTTVDFVGVDLVGEG
jgi:hypothetical protein